MIQYLGSAGAGIGTVMTVRAVAVIAQVPPTDTWRAIGELGIAIVISAVSFFGLVWWFRINVANQRNDTLALSAKYDRLEQFQQEKLIAIVSDTSKTLAEAAAAVNCVAARLEKLADSLDHRPCVAIARLSHEKREEVRKILEL